MRGGVGGAVLVIVLLLSAAVWTLLAALLLTLRLQHEVMVAAIDQRLARTAASAIVEGFREYDWWTIDPLAREKATGGGSSCTWEVTPITVQPNAALYDVEVRLGRARVTLDATAHRSLTAP